MHTLSEIAALLNVPVQGDGGTPISGINSLRDAGPSDLSFLTADRYLNQFRDTRAAAVIVQKKVKLPPGVTRPLLLVDDAELALAKVLERFAPPVPHPPPGVDPSAKVHPTATVGQGAAVGANVVIGARSRLGLRCRIHAGVYIGDDVSVGDDCELFPHVVIRERITIGDRVVIHAGSVLGTDGFGYRWDGARHAKVPQIGTVLIEDDVEIGSCVCIDRAKFSVTRIGRGTKIDNLVQVGHNVQVGAHCIIVGQCGIAGSAKLEDGVVLGGASAVRDHVTIHGRATVAACAAVMEDVEANAVVSGVPALPHRQSLREQAALRRLPELTQQVRKLQEELEQLRKLLGK